MKMTKRQKGYLFFKGIPFLSECLGVKPRGGLVDRSNRPFSHSQYWGGSILQLWLMWQVFFNANYINLRYNLVSLV